ncbi:hypothetical protein RQP54_13945 [Curvibacter sp. APW13]|uniref:transporter substrate-binding domain-containing protein n=1 Tax=Curvibacter sp. APW13 TaxID=3077236 RepID=UPI0028E02643|nr:transporter substrate-binding domain-containing protein [Curvibacter sp. APW13]MDT8991969.1 hypothetical protein [Curvibacter sp. APW13]
MRPRFQPQPLLLLRGACIALLAGLGAHGVFAGCSRPIIVPAAPTGFNVIVDGDKVSGVLPDWLNALGRRIGCSFEFPAVPRARADQMVLDAASADILLPASQNSERDAKAVFVHLYSPMPVLVSHGSKAGEAPRDTVALKKSGWRAAMVRRYSFGAEYDALARDLDAEGRIDAVNDLATIERMLRAGRVEFTILPATLMHAALLDGKPIDNAAEFRYQELTGLVASPAGAYLSARALPAKDLELLRTALSQGARDGSLKRAFEAYYPPNVLRNDRFLR